MIQIFAFFPSKGLSIFVLRQVRLVGARIARPLFGMPQWAFPTKDAANTAESGSRKELF